MSSGPNLSLSTPIPSSDFLGPLSWRLPSLRNTRPSSRPETGAQHISWSQGRSISRSPPRRPWLVTGAFFLSTLSTYFSDVVHYSGTECSFSLLSFTSVPPDSVLDIALELNSYFEWPSLYLFEYFLLVSKTHKTSLLMGIWAPMNLGICLC